MAAVALHSRHVKALTVPKGHGEPRLSPAPPARPQNGSHFGDAMLISFFAFLAVGAMFALSAGLYFVVRRRLRLTEDELVREEENQAYLELNLDEQELYFQLKEYLASNPYIRDDLTLSQNLSIQEKGVMAWEFTKDPILTNNDLMIVNKCELNFFKKYECSTQTNLPMPSKNEVYYFETKIYSLPDPEVTRISIGLAIKPYPWFRLPGRHPYSICYDSDGYRRYNQPFKLNYDPPFPALAQGDVVGVGYRMRSGTVFFTRNGKKVSELKIGGHIKNFKLAHGGQIYPTIGANNLCSLHVNVGQRGYVFIEGNVKKWGFAPLEGNGPAPPAYNKFNGDILLERSEIDEENDLVDRDNDFPPDFWEIHGHRDEEFPANDEDMDLSMANQDKFSYNAYSEVNSTDERITLSSLLPSHNPPSYNSDSGPEEASDSDGDDQPLNPGENASEGPEIGRSPARSSENDARQPRENVQQP